MKSEQTNEKGYTIRPARIDEWDEAIHLVWKTFVQFDAKDYPKEGADRFAEFITDETLHRMFVIGAYEMFLVFLDETIIGVITLRDRTHISLLFVDGLYQRKGIGSMMIDYVKGYVQYVYQSTLLTVNAAPSAIGFYEHLGFIHVKEPFIQKGMLVAPMQLGGTTRRKEK